jgi:hypothetical protein
MVPHKTLSIFANQHHGIIGQYQAGAHPMRGGAVIVPTKQTVVVNISIQSSATKSNNAHQLFYRRSIQIELSRGMSGLVQFSF